MKVTERQFVIRTFDVQGISDELAELLAYLGLNSTRVGLEYYLNTLILGGSERKISQTAFDSLGDFGEALNEARK